MSRLILRPISSENPLTFSSYFEGSVFPIEQLPNLQHPFCKPHACIPSHPSEKRIGHTFKNVLAKVGAKYPRWREILTEIYARWQREPFPNRIRDMGDFNWERMANAAAAQAFLSSVPMPTRSVSIETRPVRISTREALEIRHTFPAIDGLQSGNGTGFGVILKLMDGNRHRAETIYPATIAVSSRPENNWILKGMNPSSRDRAFEAMLNGPIDIQFGHLEPVVSLMKYEVLQLEPPGDYFEALAKFQRGLRSKLAEHEFEMKKLEIRSLSIDSVRELLEPGPSNLVAFPNHPKELVATGAAENESVFVASLESVYAARVLAVFGEKATAAKVLVSLIPKAWILTADERVMLSKNLETSDSDQFVSADLDDGSKIALLSQVFQGLEESLGSVEARRLLIRWLASVKDEQLFSKAQRLLAQACGGWLLNP